MPLRNHATARAIDQWPTVHGSWGTFIMARLNRYFGKKGTFEAKANLHVGTKAEVDVGTLEVVSPPNLFTGMNGVHQPGSGGGVATLPETAAEVELDTEPDATVEAVTFASSDLFEVQVFGYRDGWKLVAAVELLSPANKDAPDSRRNFAIKCASYLQAGVSVAVVDVVPPRAASFHNDLCDLLDLPAAFRWASASTLAAASYRTAQGRERPGSDRGNGQVRLDAWRRELTIGNALPTLPLWLTANVVVPLELEPAYTDALDAMNYE
jgi:hypothetical protein